MKTILKSLQGMLTAALLIACAATAHARSWRINNDATKKPHFADINAAMSSSDVVAGDTLYLDPGCNLTANQAVTKKVNIIGTGYFLAGNVHQPATIGGSSFNLKAEGIKVEGCMVTATTVFYSNNITLERCRLQKVTYSGTAQNAIVRQCYITDQVIGASATSTNTSGWTIENCIILLTSWNPIDYLYMPVIRNNYIKTTLNESVAIARVSGGTITDNILAYGSSQSTAYWEVKDCAVSNNVFVSQKDFSEDAVFALTGSNDERYRLKDDSPAKGAATNGGDCGPFDGRYPYVCSGFPLGMPRFASSTVPTRPEDGQLRVTQTVALQGE